MDIKSNNYSIAELIEMIQRRDLIVNRAYQRGSGIWPQGARSYFIDTVLNGFPFPKLYFFEYLDRATKKVKRELVDGQQRVGAIVDFHEGKFALSGETDFAGDRFDDLDEDVQDRFLSYPVSVDVIRNATEANILQMFRRMNAFTLPLNEAEKRHSGFQGSFKWFVNELADELNEFFVEFGVFSNRQVVRMADAELLADTMLAFERGVISTSPSDLRGIYRRYDDDFPMREEYRTYLRSAFDFIVENFGVLRKSFLMKPYALHSLLTGLVHNRYGLAPIDDQLVAPTQGVFARDADRAAIELSALAASHEAKEIEGPYAQYVWGCLGGTNRAPRRAARLKGILAALGNPVQSVRDADLAA